MLFLTTSSLIFSFSRCYILLYFLTSVIGSSTNYVPSPVPVCFNTVTTENNISQLVIQLSCAAVNIKVSSSLLGAVLSLSHPVLWTSGIVSSGLRFSAVVLIIQLHRLACFYFAFLAVKLREMLSR